MKADVSFIVGTKWFDNVLCMSNDLKVFAVFFFFFLSQFCICYKDQSNQDSCESESNIRAEESIISEMAFTVFSTSSVFYLIKNMKQSNKTDSFRLVPLCAFHTACSQVPIIEAGARGA